jgi:signal peptidase I
VEALLSSGELMRGTWPQALRTFLFPILMVLAFRWLLIEPFVIPSGSMIPNLLVHDHILVNKLHFGVKVPFSNVFLWQWAHPRRGQVVVFRFPENPELFYVKRVIAVGGDKIEVKAGRLIINGKEIEQQPLPKSTDLISLEPGFSYFWESALDASTKDSHVVRYENRDLSHFSSVTVPEHQFFVMGDNRDQSSDSRYWGYVPEQNLVGTAAYVWLACGKTLESAAFICDPQTIHWRRIGLQVQ